MFDIPIADGSTNGRSDPGAAHTSRFGSEPRPTVGRAALTKSTRPPSECKPSATAWVAALL